MATAAVAIALGLGALGQGDEGGGPSAALAAQTPAPELIGTDWLLVRAADGPRVLTARPNIDSTMRIKPDGRFLITSCNNVFGNAILGTGDRAGTVFLDGGSSTWRTCPGRAGAVDALLAEAAAGRFAWALTGPTLTLHDAARGITLDYRVRDSMRPPLDAVPIATLESGRVSCRAMVGGSGDALRLYVLSRSRPGGPWRLLRSGPAAPGEGPVRSTLLTDPATGRGCVLGFAPAGATAVTYQPDAAARATTLQVHQIPNGRATVYAGVIPAADAGRITATDPAAGVLARWPTAR